MGSRKAQTLNDIFEVLEIDPDGKKFDKGKQVDADAMRLEWGATALSAWVAGMPGGQAYTLPTKTAASTCSLPFLQ